MDEETVQLRQYEAAIDRKTRELDRLAIALLPWPSRLVVNGMLRPGTWAYLPDGWQMARNFEVTPLIGLPPWKCDRVIGVSVVTARMMVKLLEGGYRGR